MQPFQNALVQTSWINKTDLQYVSQMEGAKSKGLSEILSLGRIYFVCLVFLFIYGIFYSAIIHAENKAPNARMATLLWNEMEVM